MNIEEKIEKALAEKSQWHGSPTLLWGKIEPKLEKKNPRWQKSWLWAGTLVAVILLVFFLHPLPNQPGGDLPEIRLRGLSIQPDLPITYPGGSVSITVDAFPIIPRKTGEQEFELTLTVYRLSENGRRLLLQKKSIFVNLDEEDLQRGAFPLLIPTEEVGGAGHYHLKLEGIVHSEGNLYEVRGESELQVLAEEKGR